MESYKREFIQFLESAGVLKFGDFTAKSGRKIPYFINAGEIKTGEQISKLGEFYAKAYFDKVGNKKTVLYGPAYKGIPIAVSVAVALAKQGLDVPFFFNRKEEKDHGEGGMFVGKTLTDGEKVVIIDDVMTSGKALRETLPKLRAAANVDISGMVITVDRMEKGTGELSAVQEAKRDFGVTVYSIVNMEDIINAIENDIVPGKEYLEKMREYRNTYGV